MLLLCFPEHLRNQWCMSLANAEKSCWKIYIDCVLNNPVFPACQAHPAPQNITNISCCTWLKIISCEDGQEVVSTLSGRDGSAINKQGSFPWVNKFWIKQSAIRSCLCPSIPSSKAVLVESTVDHSNLQKTGLQHDSQNTAAIQNTWGWPD